MSPEVPLFPALRALCQALGLFLALVWSALPGLPIGQDHVDIPDTLSGNEELLELSLLSVRLPATFRGEIIP